MLECLGLHPSPSSLGAHRALSHCVPHSLCSVLPFLQHIPVEVLPQPCSVRLHCGIGLSSSCSRAGVCSPGCRHPTHKPRQKKGKSTSWKKVLLLSLFLGVKFTNIHTSQFFLNCLCHYHCQPKAAAKCSACFCWWP